MKQPVVLGGLLALSLVGAYVSWTTPDAEEPAGEVLVLRATADELVAVTWKEEDKTVRLSRPQDERGAYFLVDHLERRKTSEQKPAAEQDAEEDRLAALDPALAEEPEDAPAEAPSPDAADAAIEEERTVFAGSEQAGDVWKAFTPLNALRQLEVAPDADLSAYGLTEPEVTLDVEVGGRTVAVELGDEAYGTRDRYARVNGKVYLLDDGTIRPLQFAKTRLVERRLHPLDEADIAQVEVQRGSDTRTFVQKHADDRAKAFWADASAPEDRDVEGSTWLGKLFRMRIRSYELGDLDQATLTPVLRFEVRTDDGARWPVQILRGADATGEQFYARSSWTRSVVELTKSLTDEAVADLDGLFDGVPPEDAPGDQEPDVDAPPHEVEPGDAEH